MSNKGDTPEASPPPPEQQHIEANTQNTQNTQKPQEEEMEFDAKKEGYDSFSDSIDEREVPSKKSPEVAFDSRRREMLEKFVQNAPVSTDTLVVIDDKEDKDEKVLVDEEHKATQEPGDGDSQESQISVPKNLGSPSPVPVNTNAIKESKNDEAPAVRKAACSSSDTDVEDKSPKKRKYRRRGRHHRGHRERSHSHDSSVERGRRRSVSRSMSRELSKSPSYKRRRASSKSPVHRRSISRERRRNHKSPTSYGGRRGRSPQEGRHVTRSPSPSPERRRRSTSTEHRRDSREDRKHRSPSRRTSRSPRRHHHERTVSSKMQQSTEKKKDPGAHPMIKECGSFSGGERRPAEIPTELRRPSVLGYQQQSSKSTGDRPASRDRSPNSPKEEARPQVVSSQYKLMLHEQRMHEERMKRAHKANCDEQAFKEPEPKKCKGERGGTSVINTASQEDDDDVDVEVVYSNSDVGGTKGNADGDARGRGGAQNSQSPKWTNPGADRQASVSLPYSTQHQTKAAEVASADCDDGPLKSAVADAEEANSRVKNLLYLEQQRGTAARGLLHVIGSEKSVLCDDDEGRPLLGGDLDAHVQEARRIARNADTEVAQAQLDALKEALKAFLGGALSVVAEKKRRPRKPSKPEVSDGKPAQKPTGKSSSSTSKAPAATSSKSPAAPTKSLAPSSAKKEQKAAPSSAKKEPRAAPSSAKKEPRAAPSSAKKKEQQPDTDYSGPKAKDTRDTPKSVKKEQGASTKAKTGKETEKRRQDNGGPSSDEWGHRRRSANRASASPSSPSPPPKKSSKKDAESGSRRNRH